MTLLQAEYPVVLAGGSTLADGFVELFENKLDESTSKFQRFSSVKRAKEPIYSDARGCLIFALTKERNKI